MKKVVLLLLFIGFVTLGRAQAQAPAGQEYIVQADDWLSRIAEKTYGDVLAYPAIVVATNARAAEDDSFAVIDNPDIIEIGQKIWLPEQVGTETAGVEPEDIIGVYKTFLPGASSPGIDETLYLNADNSVRWLLDFLTGDPPIIELGSWEIENSEVVITITGQEDRTYDSPVVSSLIPVPDGLLLPPGSDAPDALAIRFLPFESLALDPGSVPYDPEAAARIIQDSGFVGFYKGFLPAASSPGRDITLLLGINDQASLRTDFLNGEPPIVDLGTWSVADNVVNVDFTDNLLSFALVDGVLKTTEAVDSYGEAGLTVYRFEVIVTSLYPRLIPESEAEITPGEPANSAAGDAVMPTEIITFVPTEIPTESQSGSCFTNAIGLGREDAYRCMADNMIYDPCFVADDASAPADMPTVVCDANPATGEIGFVLTLTEPLPEPDVGQLAMPWLVELSDGQVCGLMTGTVPGVGDRVAPYGCPDGSNLFDDFQQGEVWMAEKAIIGLNDTGYFIEQSDIVPISRIWQ